MNIIMLSLAAVGYGGLVYYYGWKAALFVFLCFWSNNIDQRVL